MRHNLKIAIAAILAAIINWTMTAKAQTTGPVPIASDAPIEVSEAEFDRIATWLGENEDAESLPEFLVRNGATNVLLEWLKYGSEEAGVESFDNYVARVAPSVASEFKELQDGDSAFMDPSAGLVEYVIQTQYAVLEDWAGQIVLAGGPSISSYVQKLMPDLYAKWDDSRDVPARTVSLDQWKGGGETDHLLSRGPFGTCNCHMMVTFSHNRATPTTTEGWDIDSKRKQLWKRQRTYMASHSSEIYAMGNNEKVEVPDDMYRMNNRTGIHVLTLCQDQFLRQCQGCVAKGKVYGAYSSSVNASAHLFGDFRLGRSESGASDLATLKSGHGEFRITQFEKGVAVQVASERKFDTAALIRFGETLAGLNFSKKATAQEKAQSGIKLLDAGIRFVKDVIVEVGVPTQNVRKQNMNVEYDGSISDSDFLVIWPNQTWAVELESEGRVSYGGRGKHRIWGEPNGTYFASGSAVGVAITDFVCPARVTTPRRVAAWAHSQDPLLAQLNPEEYPTRLSEFFKHVLNVVPPDTRADQGSRSY